MEAIVFIILQIFLATGADLKFGEILGYSSVFDHLTFLDQSRASENIWPRLFKERITLTQRINRYPADKIYPIASTRLLKGWIALSSHYPVDKFIRGKVGSINFYPPDKREKNGGRSSFTSPSE